MRVDPALRELLAAKGGIGVIAGTPEDVRAGARAGIRQTLELMGFTWTADCDTGVTGHLCGKLKPAPAVPVSAADGGRALASAAVTEVRWCKPCGQFKPDAEFGWWNRALGRRSPYCKGCNREQSRRDHAAKVAARTASDARSDKMCPRCLDNRLRSVEQQWPGLRGRCHLLAFLWRA
jgi:hypothetical protein